MVSQCARLDAEQADFLLEILAMDIQQTAASEIFPPDSSSAA